MHRACMYVNGWMYVCKYACLYVRMCVCMYVCMLMYVYSLLFFLFLCATDVHAIRSERVWYIASDACTPAAYPREQGTHCDAELNGKPDHSANTESLWYVPCCERNDTALYGGVRVSWCQRTQSRLCLASLFTMCMYLCIYIVVLYFD